MSDPVVLAAIIVVAVGGLAIGFLLRGYVATQAIKAAQEKSERIIADARTQQNARPRQAEEAQVRAERTGGAERRARRSDRQARGRRLRQGDEQLHQRSDPLVDGDRKLLIGERE